MTDTTLDLMARLEAAIERLRDESVNRGNPWLATLALAKVNEAQAELIALATAAARPTPRAGLRRS